VVVVVVVAGKISCDGADATVEAAGVLELRGRRCCDGDAKEVKCRSGGGPEMLFLKPLLRSRSQRQKNICRCSCQRGLPSRLSTVSFRWRLLRLSHRLSRAGSGLTVSRNVCLVGAPNRGSCSGVRLGEDTNGRRDDEVGRLHGQLSRRGGEGGGGASDDI